VVSINQLYLIFSDKRIFPRRRIDPYIKAISVKAYTLGLSLAQVREFLKEKGYNVSREAIRKWFLKAGEIISNNKIKKRAREIKFKEIIALHVSKGRGIGECLTFLEKVKEACINNLTIYTDKGPWYIWPMKFLKLKHRRKTFGIRNSIESWFSKLKRTVSE